MRKFLIPFLLLFASGISSPLYAAGESVDFEDEEGLIDGDEGLLEDDVGTGKDDSMDSEDKEGLIGEDDDLIEEQADVDSGIEEERDLNEDDDLVEEGIDVSDEDDAGFADEEGLLEGDDEF